MSWSEEYQENAYYLHNRKEYSKVFTKHIEELFQDRVKRIYLDPVDLSKNGIKGTYTDSDIQRSWEDFHSGFRLGEDSINGIKDNT